MAITFEEVVGNVAAPAPAADEREPRPRPHDPEPDRIRSRMCWVERRAARLAAD